MNKIIKYQQGAKSPSEKKPTQVFFKPEYPYTEPSAFMYSYYHSPNHRKNVEKELYESGSETRQEVYDSDPSYLTSDVNELIKNQLQQLKTVKLKVGENPEDNFYTRSQHTVVFKDPGAISHELAHATQPNNYTINNQFLKALKLYKADDQLNSTAKNVIFNKIFDENKSKGLNAANVEDYLNQIYKFDAETHDLHPNEVRSDIYQLRQDLYRSGIFDARTQKFNKEHLKHAKSLYDKGTTLNRLFKAYSDEDLIDLMNSVVENVNTEKQNNVLYAQNGTTLTGPTIRGKQYPRGTIVTNDPNDPRIKAYRDSTEMYNYTDWFMNYMKNLWNVSEIKINDSRTISESDKKERLKHLREGTVLDVDSDGKMYGYRQYGTRIVRDPYPTYHTKIAPIKFIDTNVHPDWLPVYKKPTQQVVYEPSVNRMTPKGLPTTELPNPKMLRMPDRIELDPTRHAAYRGMKVTHYKDELGRETAKINMVTKPGVEGKLGTFFKEGGIIKFQSGGKPTTQDSLQLLENSNAVRKYYDNPKYDKDGGEYVYEDDDHMHKYNLEALNEFIERGRKTYTHQGHKTLPLSVYYQNIDENKYKQREGIHEILDIRSPMTLYDRRINPRTQTYYNNSDQNDPLDGDAVNIPTYSRLQLTPINQLTLQERIERQKLYGVNPGETNYLMQPKKTLQQVSKFIPTSRPKSKLIRMTSKSLPATPQLIPNERILPEVVYKDSNVPNNAYDKGINVTHFTDSLGRYAAKLNLTTENRIFGRLSIPNPQGNYRIKYQSGGILKFKPSGIMKYQSGSKTIDQTLVRRNIHTNKPVITPYEQWLKQRNQKKNVSEIAEKIKADQTQTKKTSEVYTDPKTKKTIVQNIPIQPTISPIDIVAGGAGLLRSGGTKLLQAGIELLNPVPTSFKGIRDVFHISKFKPNPNAYYRMLGKDGYKDALQSGVLRSNPSGVFADRATYYTKGKLNDKLNPVVGGNVRKGTYYEGPYMAEVTPGKQFPITAEKLNSSWNFGKSYEPISISEDNVRLFKQHWLRGYKEVPKTLDNTKQLGFFNSKGALQRYPKGPLTPEEITTFRNSHYFTDESNVLRDYAEESLNKAISGKNRDFVNQVLYGGKNWSASNYIIAGIAGSAYPSMTGIWGLAFSPSAVKNKVFTKTGISDPRDYGFLSSKDTTINLTNRNLSYAKINEIKDGTVILGGEFVESTNNSVRKAKDWLNANDTYGDKKLPSKDIKSFYGVENDKFKVGTANEFDPNTEIVPMRFGNKNIKEAILRENGEMRLLDSTNSPIYQNTPNTGKFILYSPDTKQSEFNYINSGQVGVKKINDFLKRNKSAQYITLDNGRYEYYGVNPEGLTSSDFQSYYEQDLKRKNNPGYNLIIKKSGGIMKYQNGNKYKASVPPVEIVSTPTGRGKFLLAYEKQNPYRPYTTTNQYLIKYKPNRVALAEASNRAEWERLRNNYADVKMQEQERIANIGQPGRVRGMNLTPEQEKNLIQTQSEGRLAWKNKDPLQKISKIAQETSLALVPELMFNQTLKGANVINDVLPIQPKLTKAFAKGLPGTKPENQRLIKSVMANSPLEKQLNKAGEISVNSILAHINRQDVSNQDKWILNRVLTKHFSGKSKIPYTELQQAVSKEIIPLNQTTIQTHSTYGLKNLGYYHPSKENYNLAIKNTKQSIAELESKKFLSPNENAELNEWRDRLQSLHLASKDAPDARTILFHNEAKFGRGSNTHFSDYDTTLGHVRVSNFQDDPNSLYLLENQSDFWQGNKMKGTKDQHKKAFQQMKEIGLKMKERMKDAFDETLYLNQKRVNQLKENELENWEQKELLGKVYPERFLQEVMDYAAKRGNTSLKLPTKETAIKIQDYTPIDFHQRSRSLKNKIQILKSPDQWEPHVDPDDVINSVTGQIEDAAFVKKLLREKKEGVINVDLFKQQLAEAQQKLKDHIIEFPHQQETIIKRYEEFPKLTKKLFNIEPKIVTDSKGNTWYEIPVPKSYLWGKAQIKALSTTPILLGAAKLSKD